MKKYSIIITGFFSYSIILGIILWYPDIFFKYILCEINSLFYITDNNVIRIQYFNIILFFSYQIFIIFFYCLFYFQIMPRTTKKLSQRLKRCIINRIFIHIITFRFNQYDFSVFVNTYSTWVESVDFAAYIRLYQGFYWDFFYIYIFIQLIFFIIYEKAFFMEKRIYNSMRVSSNFWSVFYRNITYRFFLYLIIFYFFGGEGIFNDFCFRLISCFFIEITCVSFNIFFFLLLIKLTV